MGEMIGMSQIQSLIDKEFNYCQDPEMINIMRAYTVREYFLHLVDRRTVNRYLQYYSDDLGGDFYTNVIRNNGEGGKAAKYDHEDILKVIYHKRINDKIQDLLRKKTKPGPFGPVPTCIYNEYIQKVIYDGIDEDYIIQQTGMTRRQLDLMSVPDELLENAFEDNILIIEGIQTQIHELEDKITELNAEQDDIANELSSRNSSSP